MHFPDIEINNELADILSWPSQKQSGQHLLIEATAGTGKTTALAALYCIIAAEKQNALALCFSKQGDFRLRKQHALLTKSTNEKIESHTFDSFAKQCLRDYAENKNWEAGNLGKANKTDDRPFKAMRKAITGLNTSFETKDEAAIIGYSFNDVVDCLELIDNIKISMIFTQAPFCNIDLDYADDYEKEMLENALEELGLPNWAYSLFLKYENAREYNDFLRVVDYAYDLSQEKNAIARYAKANNIKYVLVDEFHDTKAVHFEIMKKLACAGVTIIAVGDRGQDIFEWRGTTSFSAFNQFEDDFIKIQHLPLTRTYRFGLPLSKYAGALLKDISNLTIRPKTKGNTPIKKIDSKNSWTTAIIETINTLQADGIANSKIAIITPNTYATYPLMKALLTSKIPFYCSGIVPFSVAREVLILRAGILLHGWYSPAKHTVLDSQALVLLASTPSFPIEKGEIIRSMLTRYNRETNQYDYIVSESSSALNLLQDFYKNEQRPLSKIAISAWLEKLKAREWFGALAKNTDENKASLDFLEELINNLMHTGANSFAQTMDDFHTAYFIKPQGTPTGKLAITSVSQCKGHEWRYVILPSIGKYDWSTYENSPLLEKKRELYVAVTRATDGVVFVKAQ